MNPSPVFGAEARIFFSGESLPVTLTSQSLRSRDGFRAGVARAQSAATKAKVAVPTELEELELPLNTYKNKEPFIGTIKSVERIVGPNATGETCHIVIDHGGKLPYWEGQSYGIIAPVSYFGGPNFLPINLCLRFSLYWYVLVRLSVHSVLWPCSTV